MVETAALDANVELLPDAEANRIISDQDLMSISTRELNMIMKEGGVARELIQRIKQRKRILRNRNYYVEYQRGQVSEYQIALTELQSWSGAASP